MNNIVVGIVGRDEEIDNVKYQAITKNNLKYLHNKCSYIGLINYNNNDFIDENTLKLCDGIIIQGGRIIYPYHYKILEYALNNNIPLLGICMGHQIIGLYSNKQEEKDLKEVSNHYNTNHKVNINKDSLLYNIFGSSLEINSRHFYKLNNISKPFKVTSISEDHVIEGLEYIDKYHYIIGVQWHPEDMDNTEKLYNVFLEEISKRKVSNSIEKKKKVRDNNFKIEDRNVK